MDPIAPAKILVVLVVALIVLGPERLPQVAKQVGKAWGDFKRFREHLESEMRGALGEGEGSPGAALAEFRETVHGTLSTSPASPDGGRGTDPDLPPVTGPQRERVALPVPPDDPSLN